MPNTDFLVIGSGVAGMTYAIKVAEAKPECKVTLVTKTSPHESNTNYAQGGVAVVTDLLNDSFEKHFEDTLIAGDGLCDKNIVDLVVRTAPDRINELIDWGTSFDLTDKGELSRGKEGGHSEYRILHHKDITGAEIARALLLKVASLPNIEVLDHYFVVDIITDHHKANTAYDNITCYGAYLQNLKTGVVETFLSKITMMASGGIGQVYETTTNPIIATGDGIALAYRAKAKIADMEFVQFHPTAFYDLSVNPSFLISEAVRGEGAILRNKKGEAFMHNYDPRKDLASRDIVAKAIDFELKKNGDDYVSLDCTHIDKNSFYTHFPNISDRTAEKGYNIHEEYIPVAPAAHYLCGGIVADENGRCSVDRLYVSGECSRTGLHGANRLASNSLLEALVFSHQSFLDSVERVDSLTFEKGIDDWDGSGTVEPKEKVLITQSRRELREIMSKYVGIVRSNKRLLRAKKRIKLLYEDTEELYRESVVSPQLCELRNMITVGYLIVEQSLKRKENKGGYYNIDCEK